MEAPSQKTQWLAAYRERCRALEQVHAAELQALTDERLREILYSLVPAETPWRPRPDWSGLVEQQAIFQRWWRKK